MKKYFLILSFVVCFCSCQQVQREDWNGKISDTTTKSDTLHAPDIDTLRSDLFQYFKNHKLDDSLEYIDDRYQRWGGPANFPAYTLKIGRLFLPDQVHALIFYSDENGAGLFVFQKHDNDWIEIFADSSDRLSAGPSVPECKDWNFDGIKDLSLYYPPAISMSVIGNYALWLMDHNGSKLSYIKGFDEIENPETDTSGHKIIGSYYYHGARRSEWKFNGNKLVKISEHWDKEE